MKTGPMYKQKNTILSDGREAMYGIYKHLDEAQNNDYDLLGEYADMHDMLESTVIGGREFKDYVYAFSVAFFCRFFKICAVDT